MAYPYQPHDPQDYRDRNPLAPAPGMVPVDDRPQDFLSQLLRLLESPPLAGPSRSVGALISGENPARAFMDMTGQSPETWQTLEERGWNPLAAMAADAAIPDMFGFAGDVSDVARVGSRIAPALGAAAVSAFQHGGDNLARMGDELLGLLYDVPMKPTGPELRASPLGDVNYEEVLDLARRELGATLSPINGALPERGFMVGGAQGNEVRINLAEAKPDDIREFAQNNQHLFRTINTKRGTTEAIPDRYVGVWMDGDDMVLDVSSRAENLDEAQALSQFRNQEAIFDVAEGKVISTPPSDTSMSPTLREYADSRETPIFRREVAGPQVAARVERIEGALGEAFRDPARRAMLEETLARGRGARAETWYDVDSMRSEFTQALGSEERAEDLIRVISLFTAATSPNTPVTTNAKRAIELTYEAFRGMDIDDLERVLAADPNTLTSIYGQSLSGTMRSRESIRQAFEQGLLNGQKIGTFHTNFLGNVRGVTVDTHNVAALLHMAGMDYTSPEGRRAIAELLEMGDPQAKKIFREAGVTDWADAKPKDFRDAIYGQISSGAEYGAFERVQQQLADELGMTPREFQAALWVGDAGFTGVRSGKPFADIFMGVLDQGARDRGVTRQALIQAIAGGSLALGALFTVEQFDELMGGAGSWAQYDDDGQIASEDTMMGLLDMMQGTY